MDLNLQERLRQELRIEVEREGALSPNLVSLLVSVLSERGKPLNSQTRSSWSDFTFDIAEMLKVKEEQALPVAIAVELALLAGDIFDDLVDQDNQEAIWSTLPTEEAKTYSIINNEYQVCSALTYAIRSW
jgi:geranylgeranyl pyrophosphate synthase